MKGEGEITFANTIKNLLPPRIKSKIQFKFLHHPFRQHRLCHYQSFLYGSQRDTNSNQVVDSQRTTRQKKHQWASPSRYWFKLILYRIFPLLLLFNTNPVYTVPITYSLPGTNHVLTQESYPNIPRQHKIVRTVIKNTIRPHPLAPSVPVGSPTNRYCRDEKCNSEFCNSASGNYATGNPSPSNPTTETRQIPHSFIDDTNSVKICMDTGANRVIFNDKTLLTDFIATDGKVKGVGSNPKTVVGTGTFNLSLQSNDVIHDKFSAKKAIYVPSSPYSLIPPQLLLQVMSEKGCVSHLPQVGEREFLLHYRRKTEVKVRTLTIPIRSKVLFLFRTSQGYYQFSQSTQKSSPDN